MASGLFTLKQQAQALRQGAWNGQKTKSVEYLVVAGGGGGGTYSGSGAGGLLQGIAPVISGSSITVTVGAGGSGSSGTVGQNSSFGPIISVGGGTRNSPNGGSGSGGWNGPVNTSIQQGGLGIPGQGNAGGWGRDTGASYYGGGGGGAGTVGFDANNGACGTGGAGIASAISGNVTAYAGGGGGGHAYGGGIGAGGVGGGGAGGDSASSGNGYNGTANTGGGGGANSYLGGSSTPGNGGSGIVIISYPDVYPAAASSTNATVSTSGSGSIAFNGAQYFQIANNSALQFGTGSFTVEGWFYITSAPLSNNSLFSIGSYNSGILLRSRGAGPDLLYINDTPYNWNPSTYFLLNQWNHVALVRNGTAVTIYVNGTSVFTTTSSANIVQSTVTTIGSATHDVGNERCLGYITNFRIVKGTALYTSNFTPSTVPLTTVTNTSYLLNAMSGGLLVDSSVNGFVPNSSSSFAPTWNSISPFTVTGYKNRVYTWTSSGSITF